MDNWFKQTKCVYFNFVYFIIFFFTWLVFIIIPWMYGKQRRGHAWYNCLVVKAVCNIGMRSELTSSDSFLEIASRISWLCCFHKFQKQKYTKYIYIVSYFDFYAFYKPANVNRFLFLPFFSPQHCFLLLQSEVSCNLTGCKAQAY